MGTVLCRLLSDLVVHPPTHALTPSHPLTPASPKIQIQCRVDLNLLVDYAWPRFLSAAPSFVAAVPSASDLGDLLLALSPSSTLAAGGLYANLPQILGWGPQQQQQQQTQQASAGAGGVPGPAAGASGEGDSGGGGSGGKVSAVCEVIRGAVLHLPGRFVPLGHLKTVVMSYARWDGGGAGGGVGGVCMCETGLWGGK